MLVKYKKPFMLICLCLSALFATVDCGQLNRASGGNSVLPVRSLMLTLDKSQREELFDQLKKFAEKHGVETRLTDFRINGEYFQFWISREDFIITASDVPPDPTLIDISFYGKNPGVPVDEEVVDDLASDLKGFISEIPNVTITDGSSTRTVTYYHAVGERKYDHHLLCS